MFKDKQNNKNKQQREYIEIKETDFYPPRDKRGYFCSFRNKCDYYGYLKEYEKYIYESLN